MQLKIHDFLKTLSEEARLLPEMRAQVQAEIERYEGMRLVLSNTEQNPEFTRNLLAVMDNYLLELKLVAQKLKYPHLALVQLNGKDETEINQYVLKILKEVNRKN